MQISKNSLVICAMALLVSAPSLRSAESEAQAKAREALRQKMSELDAQAKGKPSPSPTAPAPVAPAPIPPAPVTPVPTAPAAVIPAPASLTPAPAPSRVDDEAIARAREAMRQKLRELDAPQHATPASATLAPPAPATAAAPIAQPQTPAPAVPVLAPVQVSPTQPTYAPVGQSTDDESTARARAALRQKMAELNGQPSLADHSLPGGGQVTYAPRVEFSPIAAPPLPVSGAKQVRLADLLRQYKADAITPEQYHKERAKVLAEP